MYPCITHTELVTVIVQPSDSPSPLKRKMRLVNHVYEEFTDGKKDLN